EPALPPFAWPPVGAPPRVPPLAAPAPPVLRTGGEALSATAGEERHERSDHEPAARRPQRRRLAIHASASVASEWLRQARISHFARSTPKGADTIRVFARVAE